MTARSKEQVSPLRPCYRLITGTPEVQQITETRMKKSRTDLLETVFGMEQRTILGLWNVRTMWEIGRLTEVLREMKRYEPVISALSEIKLTGFGESRSQDMKLLYSGRTDGNH